MSNWRAQLDSLREKQVRGNLPPDGVTIYFRDRTKTEMEKYLDAVGYASGWLCIDIPCDTRIDSIDFRPLAGLQVNIHCECEEAKGVALFDAVLSCEPLTLMGIIGNTLMSYSDGKLVTDESNGN
jgi:hypothetical protein